MLRPAMIQRLVDTMSRAAIEKRLFIVIVSALLAIAFITQLPRLKVDTSPEALVSEIEGQQAAEELFEKHFGRSESQLLVVISAPDVMSTDALKYQRTVHDKLAALPVSAEVDGITHLSLPRQVPVKAELNVGVLPEQQRQGFMMQIEAARKEGKFPSEATLRAIVDAEPDSFDGGVDDLVVRLAEAKDAPTLGDTPSDDDVHKFARSLEQLSWVSPFLLSRDHTATVQVVHFAKDKVFDESSRMRALDEVRQTIAGIPAPKDLRVRYGGSPVLGEAILKKLEKDRFVLNPLMALVCLVVLAFTFRWWVAVVAPLLAVGLAALGVMGGLAALGQPLTILTNIIPPLLLIVGLSDSVHLLGRYHEEVRIFLDRRLAGKAATRAMLVACFLTSLTTAVGFGSLASAKTSELQRFGLAASIGVIIAYFATVFLVPAFVSFFKLPKAWTKEDLNEKHKPSLVEKAIFVVTRQVLRHHYWVAILSVLATVGLGYAASKVTADARLMDAFDTEEEVSQTTQLLEQKLSGIRPLEVVFTGKNDALLQPAFVNQLSHLSHKLAADEQIIGTNSYLNLLAEARGTLVNRGSDEARDFGSLAELQALSKMLGDQGEADAYLTADHSAARMTVYFKDSGVRHTLQVVEQFEKDMQKPLADSGVRMTLLGEAYTGSKGRQHVLQDLLSGLGLALVVIFGLLALLFRSLPLGLVAMPPNVIPLLATGAYMMARGIQLNLTTVITFSIGIGLAVDDTVHVVARYREEQKRVSSVRVALLRAARGTGTAIFVTAISLTLGFAVLMLSEFVSVRQFGELIAITVLNCLIGALLIQPALLRLVNERRRRRSSSP